MHKAHSLAMLIPCAAVLAACQRSEMPPVESPALTEPAADTTMPWTAAAALAGASGSSVTGQLTFTGGSDGVTVSGELTGLPPESVHGFHIHESGDCSAPDAKSAGEHFNPEMALHGAPGTTPRHLGDIPNIQSDATGRALVNATIDGATLGDAGPHDLVGKAVIAHAKPDDYKTQPSGDSGDRIACGVIR